MLHHNLSNLSVLLIVIITVLISGSLCSSENVESVWHSYQFNSGYGNRKELFISKVESVLKFSTLKNVVYWRTLAARDRTFALGQTENGVLLLSIVANETIPEQLQYDQSYTPMNGTILDALMFKHWNVVHQRNEIITVVATQSSDKADNTTVLQWFRIDEEINKLIPIWEWHFFKQITHLNVFKLENKYNILIANQRSNQTDNYATLDWYEFNLSPRTDFWLKQVINITRPITSTAINVLHSQTFLSIPQYSSLEIYKLSEMKSRFDAFKTINVEFVSFVKALKIGMQTYLAIDGPSAGIYKFTKDDIIKEHVDTANLNDVDYWLSIPISTSTINDEEIIIAERKLDFNTHKSHALQAIIHHGGHFVLHEEMACDYFGEISSGLDCLVEEEKGAKGIKGSAFFNVNGTLGVLVPRNGKSSSLFLLHTEVKELLSPVEHQMHSLDARREQLQTRINALRLHDERKKRQVPIESNIDPTEERVLGLAERISKLQVFINDMENSTMKLPSLLDGRPSYGTLILNNVVKVQGPSTVDHLTLDSLNDAKVAELALDIYNVDDQRPISGKKTFHNLQVDGLEVQILNGIPEDKLLKKSKQLVIHGDVITELVQVENDVITETLNNVTMENELVFISPAKHFNGTFDIANLNVNGALKAKMLNEVPLPENYRFHIDGEIRQIENIALETVFLPGNLTVTNINSERFDGLISTLCLNNIRTYIPNLTIIEGNLFVKNEAATLHLNGLQYPQDYVTAKQNSFTRISAKKFFSNELIVDELTTHGTVNGVEPNEVITLSGNQNITGKITFDQLQVTNALKLDGDIVGSQPENLLPNPSLFDSNELNANVVFKQLEITGNIISGSKFNGTNLDSILSDTIYKTEESSVNVIAMKTFPQGLSVLNDLQISSNSINNVNLKSFINKDVDEVLNMSKLYGDVTFENLNLMGTFGGVDIVKLDQDAVKLSGEQFITSKIVFEDTIIANEMNIMQTMNDISLDDHLSQKGRGELFLEHLNLDNLRVGNLIVQGDIHADDANFDISQFDSRRLSLTKPQFLNTHITLNSSRIEELRVQRINEHIYEDLFDMNAYTNKIIDMLFIGRLKIAELVVNGSLQIEMLNNITMQTILKNCLNSQGGARKLELYLENAQISELTVDKFNGLQFEEFKSNLVYKNASNLEISGLKQYLNGVEVKNYIQTTQVNKISVHDILRTTGQQEITSPIVILGDVTLHGDNQISSTFNQVPIENITNAFEVIDENHYRIKGDAVFPSNLKVLNLSTKFVNGEDIQEHLRGVMYLQNENATTLQNITFASKVFIDGNLNVDGQINGVNLNELKNDLVLISKDATFEHPVHFDEVIITGDLQVESDLWAESINGFNPENWKSRALFINRGKILGRLHFEEATIENNLHVDFVNNLNMSHLVHLREENSIETLNVKELASFKDIEVLGEVNGAHLESEYRNTALSGNIHLISDNVIFKGNILIRKYMDVMNLVNENDLAKIVTTDTDQNLTAAFRFNDKFFANDVWVHGQINSVNITKWALNGAKTTSEYVQTISNPWLIDRNLTFDNNVDGYGYINGLNIKQLADKVEYRRGYKSNVENELADNYKRICDDINMVQQRATKQIFKFKYLDFKQAIELEDNVEFVHYFKHLDNYYIIIKEEGCRSKVFQWVDEQFTFLSDFESGNASQIISVPLGDDFYLIFRDSEQSNCSTDGTNVWKFELEQPILLNKLKDQKLLQSSTRQGTFYGLEKDSNTVNEFKIVKNSDISIIVIEKWNLPIDNATFMPQGLKTGLALRNSKYLVQLKRLDSALLSHDPEVHSVAIGNFAVEENHHLPHNNEDMLLVKVGYPRWKTMMAVASHEETSVKDKLDHIKIYDGPLRGSIFHKVPTYKPSSMVSLEFGENGETLLIFLENRQTLQVFEYKGIEGFKQRTKANIDGNALISLKLPTDRNKSLRNFVGILNGNHFNLLVAVMDGDQLEVDPLHCAL